MTLEPGIRVLADLRDYMFLYYFVRGFDQDPSFQLVRRLVRPGETVVDVGANVGLWLMGVAQRVGDRGSAHAFEPFPSNFDRLRDNLKLNGLDWVVCHQLAVANEIGQTSLMMPPGGNSGLAHLASTGSPSSVSVRMTTLDAFCEEQKVSTVNFLKVDVEGAELRVFEGAKRLLSGAHPPAIMFEVGEALASAFGTSSAEVKECLLQHGYEVYRYHRGRLSAVSRKETHPGSEDLFGFRSEHLREYPLLAQLLGRVP